MGVQCAISSLEIDVIATRQRYAAGDCQQPMNLFQPPIVENADPMYPVWGRTWGGKWTRNSRILSQDNNVLGPADEVANYNDKWDDLVLMTTVWRKCNNMKNLAGILRAMLQNPQRYGEKSNLYSTYLCGET